MNKDSFDKDPFKEYIRESEPAKRDKRYTWHTGIGLQAVDGLKTSDYLVRTAVRNIEGEISFEEANALLQAYYEENQCYGNSIERVFGLYGIERTYARNWGNENRIRCA